MNTTPANVPSGRFSRRVRLISQLPVKRPRIGLPISMRSAASALCVLKYSRSAKLSVMPSAVVAMTSPFAPIRETTPTYFRSICSSARRRFRSRGTP